MFGIGFTELLVLLAILLVVGPSLWCLVDVLKNEFTGSNKIIWLLVVVSSFFIPVIGWALYLLIGRNQKI